jgi:threonylcarbamoyladenosine tRNA methylthiotransferase MtaB
LSVEVLNFGCRLNLAEGETLRTAFAGHDDLILINSCAVTAEAERQARQAIRKAAARRPDARIVVTGCAAQTNAQAFLDMPQVSSLWDKREAQPATPAVSGAGHARAFIEAQNGCDHRCTFCIIPYGRGDSRSTPVARVIEAVNAAVERGQQEVVLTGVDLTSYGPDLAENPGLGGLVEAVLDQVPALPRLRLSSLDSIEIDPLLEDILTSEPRMMPHVHLSLQHGDDLILKRMKRRHSRADAIALVSRLKERRPEIAIGADIIAGFPTEDEAMFASSLSLLDDCDVVLAHIFPYSPRPGTPAARMPQLDRALVRNRAKRLRAVAESRKSDWLESLVGTVQRVLIELDGQTGHAPNFATVCLERPLSNGNMRGQMIETRITRSDGATLFGGAA